MGFKKVKITDEVAAAVKAELEQAVAAAEPVKKEKKEKKAKVEKKAKTEKKEKADKKEKAKTEVKAEPEADTETNTDAPVDTEMPDADATADSTADADNEPTNATASKKRKSEIEEIEVDLSLPEPPSKKAKRMLKKGKDPNAISKAKKKAAASDEDLLDVAPGGDDAAAAAAGDKKDGSKKPRSEHCVWVGNLPFHVTTSDLRKWLVDNAGGVILETSITRVKMPSSKEHKLPNGERQNKGFAYVDFDTLGGKVAAIALSENMLGSRKLLIKDSTSFEGRPKVEAAADGDKGKNKAAEEEKVDPKTLTKSERDATKKVYVGNLPFAATEDDVYTLFEKCGDIDWVKVATFEDSGKCKGYGWVKFKEAEAAAAAVKGWILLPQFEDKVEDFQTEEDKAAAAAAEEEKKEEDEEEAKPKKAKKQKMRKWHVNRLKGRELKVELAEDNKVRYEKRFGRLAKNKAGKGAADGAAGAAGAEASAVEA